MHVRSLTLKGFKSFASATTFQFEPGVTCVVGPNGSGKSNVVDALAWVMGEQGAKTLRGGKMEDVIFAGTSTRGPLGRAEVTLTIDNSDGALPIDYSEVTIRRTLFRNGASEYAINGESSRLLDVQELLSDSGLGREMHVIVGQGRLDNVLHASPEERRGFIEEAAGILKHRRRKEKTVRKLENMQANLTRLNDLAGEVRRQLKPLGRQAAIAREAQSIARIVRDAKARILAEDVSILRRDLHDASRSEKERTTERIVLQEQIDQLTIRAEHIVREQTNDAADVARRTLFELESVAERVRNLHSLASQREVMLASQVRDSENRRPQVAQADLDAAREEAERLASRVAELETAWRETQQATATAREKLDAVDEEIAAQSALISQHDLEVQKLSGRRDAAQSRLAAVRGEVLRHENALAAAAERLADAEREMSTIDDSEDGPEGSAADLNEAYEFAQSALFEAENEADALRDKLHRLERERDAFAARESALAMALDQRDGGVELARSGADGVTGLAADSVSVTAGFETAIGQALGGFGEAVLASSLDTALAALAHAEAEDLGRVGIVVGDAQPKKPDVKLPEGLVWAESVVDAPSGIRALLAFTAIADDIAAAKSAVAAMKTDVPITVITRAGEVVTESLVRGGSGTQRSRVEILAEHDGATKNRESAETAIESIRMRLADARGEAAAAKERSALALQTLREFDAQLAQQTERQGRAAMQLEAAKAERERLAQALAEARDQVQQAEETARAASREYDIVHDKPRPMLDVTQRDELYAALEGAREREVQARLEVETARERSRAQAARAKQVAEQLVAEQLVAEQNAAAAAAKRLVQLRADLDRARTVTEALPALAASVDSSVAEARVELSRAEAERAEQNRELQQLRAREGEMRARLASVTESVHGLEMQIYEKKLQISQLLERAGSELGLVEDVLIAEYGPDVPVPDDGAIADARESQSADADADAGEENAAESDEHREPANAAESDNEASSTPGTPYDRAEQKRRLAAAERKLAQLGRVNPLALEEFAALEERHKFLTEQLADLTKTREDLLAIVREIDERMQIIFESAFRDTQAAFDEVFPTLFPGGSGSLTLTNPDDLLTTGIEVAVRPAGKKIERLSLLSGGERSLAAVALLIAIFKARPSPFYIMDEVEAALDDANLGRLLTIFESLRETSQLIVITHQKRTMEIADVLYGVSMRQDGVSAIVGQRVGDRAKQNVE